MRTTFSFIHFSGFFGNFAFDFFGNLLCERFCLILISVVLFFFLLGILLTWRQVHQTRLIRSPPASSGNWLGYQPLNLNPNPNLWGFLAKSESLVIWMPKASHAALFTSAVGLSGFKKQVFFGQCICVGLVSLRWVFIILLLFLFCWPGDVKTFAKSALNWFAGRRSNWFYTRIASDLVGIEWIALERSALVSQRYIRCIRNGQKRWFGHWGRLAWAQTPPSVVYSVVWMVRWCQLVPLCLTDLQTRVEYYGPFKIQALLR